MKVLGTIQGVDIVEQDDGSVHFLADADIDADGSNGQYGQQAAYRFDNKGSELLANGGMAVVNGKVIFSQSWGKDIVLLNGDNPKVLDTGVIPSKTAYKFPDKDANDPEAYVDSETIPYIVVPPLVRQKTKGIVLGAKAIVVNTLNGKSVDAVVADIGPRTKIGELSIAAAKAIGIPSSPRTGGTDKKVVLYEIWPGTPAVVGNTTFTLLPA